MSTTPEKAFLVVLFISLSCVVVMLALQTRAAWEAVIPDSESSVCAGCIVGPQVDCIYEFCKECGFVRGACLCGDDHSECKGNADVSASLVFARTMTIATISTGFTLALVAFIIFSIGARTLNNCCVRVENGAPYTLIENRDE